MAPAKSAARLARALLLLTTTLSLAACAGVKYESDFAREGNFEAYETYAWHPRGNNLPDDVRYNNDIIRNRIRKAVESAMASKGFTPAPAGQADVLVAFHAAVDGRMNNEVVINWYGYPYFGYGSYYGWGGWGATTTVNYWDQGTLLVDLLENQSGDRDPLVWRGMASAAIKERADEAADRDARMNSIIANMFRAYPPGADRR